jgi:hypothetical protein
MSPSIRRRRNIVKSCLSWWLMLGAGLGRRGGAGRGIGERRDVNDVRYDLEQPFTGLHCGGPVTFYDVYSHSFPYSQIRTARCVYFTLRSHRIPCDSRYYASGVHVLAVFCSWESKIGISKFRVERRTCGQS